MKEQFQKEHTIQGDCAKNKPKSPFRQILDEDKSLNDKVKNTNGNLRRKTANPITLL